ncbi:hypothetical protein ACSBR2_011130 [Camellia fascicularis]
MTHEDFEAHKGTIGVGDLQWMTAGRGIVHSEMLHPKVLKRACSCGSISPPNIKCKSVYIS